MIRVLTKQGFRIVKSYVLRNRHNGYVKEVIRNPEPALTGWRMRIEWTRDITKATQFAMYSSAQYWQREIKDEFGPDERVAIKDFDKEPRPDIRIDNHGSIVIFQPLTDAARKWVDETAPADAQRWMKGGLVVEPRYACDVIMAAQEAGFNVYVP